MSSLKGRLSRAEELIAFEARDKSNVKHIYPPKYTEETEEAYQERLRSSEELPHKTVTYPGGLSITLPAKLIGEPSE